MIGEVLKKFEIYLH
jgi:hypothetical protein